MNYPVARGTPMLASMVKWDHSMEWSVADFGGKVSLFKNILDCLLLKHEEEVNFFFF